MTNVFQQIVEEMVSQNAKWGVQDHPSVDKVLLRRRGGCSPSRMCQYYQIPDEQAAKFACEQAATAHLVALREWLKFRETARTPADKDHLQAIADAEAELRADLDGSTERLRKLL